MSQPRARGFTLIELLTVIAIIAILVGFTAAVLPRVLEKAKIAKTESAFKQIKTSLAAYQTDNGTLPPGYGYRWNPDIYSDTVDENGNRAPVYWVWNLEPYMSKIKHLGDTGLYDEYWATNYDTNRSSHIDSLEFQPVPPKSASVSFFNSLELYTGANLPDQVTKMNGEVPPYAYFPVNRAQADKLRAFCEKDPSREFAGTTDLKDFFRTLSFPPPYYDDYVLISPGPAGNTFGVIPPDANLLDAPDLHDDIYYINALRTFYLATRDKDGNNAPDFDFRARTRGGEKDKQLPDPNLPFGAGPLIFHSGG